MLGDVRRRIRQGRVRKEVFVEDGVGLGLRREVQHVPHGRRFGDGAGGVRRGEIEEGRSGAEGSSRAELELGSLRGREHDLAEHGGELQDVDVVRGRRSGHRVRV